MAFFVKKQRTRMMVVVVIAVCLVLSGYTPTCFSETANVFTLPCTIDTYGNAWNGELTFPLSGPNNSNYLVVMDTNGSVVNLRESNGYNAVYNIANNTLLFQGEPYVGGAGTAPTYATHIWNLATNTTEDFFNVISHHDIQYDPFNNTFLTLQDYVKTVGNNSILYDKIVEVDAEGNALWTWDTYDYIPLSEASPFNETSSINGQTVIDFTHANSLDWDYNDSIIYLNLRNTNTFYEINQTTGDIIWACGEFGNFTLLGADGQQVSSLWYHSHDLKEVAPDVFTMFNNDYENNTNPADCHSSLIELTLNETNMTAYVNWSWEAPTQYWTTYGGATVILPNGDFLGDFGDPTHEYSQNQPWDFNDTGAVFIEVNTTGQIVRTFTFPVGYYAYRVDALTVTSPLPSQTVPLVFPVALTALELTAATIMVAAIQTFKKKRRQT